MSESPAVIHIGVVNASDGRTADVDIDPANTPAELIRALIDSGEALSLPAGQSYVLALKGGHQLSENESFAVNGVAEGATLLLVAPTPGAAWMLAPSRSAAANAEFNRERAAGNYREMCNIRCEAIQWEGIGGTPPNVYNVTFRIPSYVNQQTKRDLHRVRFVVNPDDASAKPAVEMLDRPPVYHPNVFPSGNICIGNTWSLDEGLGFLTIRIAKMLLYYDIFTNPDHPANGEAARWYKSNRRLFPLGASMTFPDPITGEVRGTRKIRITRRS